VKLTYIQSNIYLAYLKKKKQSNLNITYIKCKEENYELIYQIANTQLRFENHLIL